MTPRRILVTGAGGFVGHHLLPAIRAAHPGAAVLSPAFDVTDASAAAAAMREARPDGIVHLAGIAAPTEARRDPDLAWRVNLGGTLTLARAVLAHAPDAVLVFAGSGDVRRVVPVRGTLDEAAALAPQNTYGATKAAADLALGALANEGLRALRVRPFNHTGPGQSDAFVVPSFARQVARIEAGLQEPVVRVGSLDPQRDFLDVRDVCAGYVACLAAELPPGTVLNLASGVPRRVGDVLRDLLALAGVSARIETEASRLRSVDIPRAVGDGAVAARLLGWTPRTPWERTLRDVLDDWRARVRSERPTPGG